MMRRAASLVAVAALASGVAAASAGSRAAATPGRVLFTDATSGPVRGGPGGLGTPITIYGVGFGRAQGRSTVTIGGRPVARVLEWSLRSAAGDRLDRIVVQPGPGIRAGRIAVRVGGRVLGGQATFTPTLGRIRVVAPSGVDAAACVPARPCATIQHVVDKVLRPGDVLLVRGPVIADDEVWIRPGAGGKPGRPKAILAYPGERPAFAGVARPLIVEGSHVTVAGLTFPGGKGVVAGADASREIRVVGNTFRGALGYDAVGTHGRDIVVAGNDCTADGSTVGTQGHCFYISNGSRIRLLYNVGRGVPGYGIHVFDQQRAAGEARRVISDVLIEGNLLASSSERSGLILAMGDEGGRGNHIRGVVIRDNVLTGNNHAGLVIGERVSEVIVEHNTFWANGRQGISVADHASVSGIRITRNLLVQPANGPCRSNCSWYDRAHLQLGVAARAVKVRDNWYAPDRVLIGARDTKARVGEVRLADPAHTARITGASPAAAYGARRP
ncbi:MAG: right-handed parallel beta-helix repeat-containing protein [Gaiella sp.]